MHKDVVVIGSGAGALTAAITAKQAGLDVLVVEKTELLGGTTARSGGMIWVPNNSYMRKAGMADSREQVLTYIGKVVGNRFRREVIEAFVDNAPAMLDWVQANTEAKFEPAGEPDYFPELEGATKDGRAFNPANYDGRRLGKKFTTLRGPLDEVLAFGGIMIDRADLRLLLSATKSVPGFMHALKLLGTYAADRLAGYPRATRLTFGNALAGALLNSAYNERIEMWTGSAARRLIREGDRITGVVVERDGGEVTIGVGKGVVMATGGFIHNDEMRRELLEYADQHQSMVIDANRGEGLQMALAAGAVLGTDTWQNVIGYQVTVMEHADGWKQKFLLLMNERSKAGSVMVGKDGKRFANESLPYHDFYHHQTAAGAVPAWLVVDHAFLRRNGLGLVRPGPAWMRPLGPYLGAGYLKRGATLRELAEQIGVDAAGLEQTVANMNRYAETGKDPEFGRGESLFDRTTGDPFHKPHPNLGKIETGPFYAVAIWPGSTGTLCGLKTNGQAQALDANDKPIQGLYACGLDMHSPFSGTFPGAGCSLGPAMTFGFTAARHMAGLKPTFDGA